MILRQVSLLHQDALGSQLVHAIAFICSFQSSRVRRLLPALPAPTCRTYRAHGRINAFMSSPCHIELILEEKDSAIKAEAVSCRGRPTA